MKPAYCFSVVVLMIGIALAAPIAEPDDTNTKISEPKDSLMSGSTSVEIQEGKPIVKLEQRSDVIIPDAVDDESKKKVEIPPVEIAPIENVPKIPEIAAVNPIVPAQSIENIVVPVVVSNIVGEPIQVDRISETSADSSVKAEAVIPEKPVEQPASVIKEEIVPKVEKVESIPVQPIVPEIVKPAEPVVEESKSVPVEEPASIVSEPKVESIQPIPIESDKPAEIAPQPVVVSDKVIESRSLKEIDAPAASAVPVEAQSIIPEMVESAPIPVESVPIISAIESQPIIPDKVETVPVPVEKSVEVQPSEAEKIESPVTISAERSIESQPVVADIAETPVSDEKSVEIQPVVPEKIETPVESQPVIAEKVESPIPVSSVQDEISVESQPIPVPSVPVETPVESQPIVPEKIDNQIPVASIASEIPVEQPVITDKVVDAPVQSVPTIVVSESQGNIVTPIVDPVQNDVKPIAEIPLIQETSIVAEPKPVVIIPQEPLVVSPVVVVPEQSENTIVNIVAKPMEIAPEPMIESVKPALSTAVDNETSIKSDEPMIIVEPNQI
ncbi:hypothetical protein HUG17_2658 [Dermatophagoides farinae]|uniref:Uncharacterized protein n=1 Tax=Dermatophagoides farinae TaxID=6954 RepID=A0A9D4NSX7_DERFA|nr:cytadherence high molecular weight protein 1-like [Dermatophagoides farinae]XP_046909808.1 cytadherence high molecular weight protein 1-like [Dermatophagoides farinae]XP_046909809.1 cytadherence high molecular weight protein 1-like [Dermatophagoides farinae]KAH7638625.1 hypothetical protein HUG17_2658 [Dermatophagoides farinae]